MYSKISLKWKKFEKTLGGLKFAVILISLFTFFMIIATFIESYFGTEFANRLIYKSFPFILIQFLLFLSILLSMFVRFPFQQRLMGFYVIHIGLLLIGVGSLITFKAGLDGSITLTRQDTNRTIVLQDDLLIMTERDSGKKITYELPFSAFPSSINATHGEVTIEEYLPFSGNQFIWSNPIKSYNSQNVHSTQYILFNNQINQTLTLSLHPESNSFDSFLNLDRFSIHYLPKSLATCFLDKKVNLVIWNSRTLKCKNDLNSNILETSSKMGENKIHLKYKGQELLFFPSFSTSPLNKSFSPLRNSELKMVSKNSENGRPQLFLFGNKIAYNQNNKLIFKSFDEFKTVSLPWMGLQIQIIAHSETKVPKLIPTYTLPKQEGRNTGTGNQKAVRLNIKGETIWITDKRATQAFINGKLTRLELGKTTMKLPFEFLLTKFRMEMNPGTNMPASYESYVKVLSNNKPEDHHIYMNNPMKKLGFTFYQSSYFQTQNGDYGSVLSANVDPGRPIKYLGSLLLVLGAILHYVVIYRRKKNKEKIS